jgi:hypothetical protein
VKSRLHQPTAAYRQKKEATLNERQMKYDKKSKGAAKMLGPSHFTTGHVENYNLEFVGDERESSPSFDFKKPIGEHSGVKAGTKKGAVDHFNSRNNSRRKRKDRFDKINYEKSPVNVNTNRYMVKHTYTKLEHDEAGPKFTVIK